MKHILIVDDDPHIGDMLEEALMREGYGVSRAFSRRRFSGCPPGGRRIWCFWI